MRSRAWRVILTLLAVSAVGAAGYSYWNTLAQTRGLDERSARFAHARLAASRATLELRGAQQAYVAAGQNAGFWFQKVSASADALREALGSLTAAAASPETRAGLTEAASALGEFEERDRRVRGYVGSGQQLLASDVIFSDGLDASGRILGGIDAAADAESRHTALARRDAERKLLMSAIGAVGAALFALLLLAPLPRPSDVGPEVVTAEADALSLLDLRPAPIQPQRPQPAADPQPPQPVATALPAVSIETLAAVCSDLARLTDASAIPEILKRTADALDASGLVVWVADAARAELVPLAAHGYPASVLSRLASVPVTAENATAAAYRTGLVQTVRADRMASGAIAAPLVAPVGCVGVMSAEVRHDGETDAARLAAASIVAAQLATIVGPPAVPSEDRNSAAL